MRSKNKELEQEGGIKPIGRVQAAADRCGGR